MRKNNMKTPEEKEKIIKRYSFVDKADTNINKVLLGK